MCVASFAWQVWSGHMGKRVAMIGRENDMATAVALDTLADTVAVGYHSGIIRVFQASIGKQTLVSIDTGYDCNASGVFGFNCFEMLHRR